jgi:hypothetical protein
MHHASREYPRAEAHFAAALRCVADDLAAAHAAVATEQTTIQAAGGVPPPSPHLAAAFRPGEPGYKGSSSGGSGKLSANASAAALLAAYAATTTGGGGASVGSGVGGARGVGRVDLSVAFRSLAKAEARVAAAVVRRDAIVLSRNMMRADREGGAQLSKPLELWTVGAPGKRASAREPEQEKGHSLRFVPEQQTFSILRSLCSCAPSRTARRLTSPHARSLLPDALRRWRPWRRTFRSPRR